MTECDMLLPVMKKGEHITPEQRKSLANALSSKYLVDRRSIRQLASQIGRSYGFVRNILLEHGVELRSRGGLRGPRLRPRKG